MSVTPREIGTLIAVVLRANHLPNKRHIGKQDPYCVVTLNGEKKRTKADKKGNQHPEWDEEIRFTIFEDLDDVLARTAKGDGTPPPLPPKDEKKSLMKIKGGKKMRVSCFADDPREPILIGECDVDLSEVLTKGETDEWFTLYHKDKFAGKVYLELTFWSNEPPPEKKSKAKPKKNNQYAGPGSFIPAGEGGAKPHTRQPSDVLPSSMRSSSLNTNLYVAPYERNGGQSVDALTQEFNGFGVSAEPRRRESFPPPPGSYSQPQYGSQSVFNGYPPHGFDQGASNPYEPPPTPNTQSSIHFPQSSSYSPYQQPAYDAPSQVSYSTPPPARGPRHSIATSSGFVPLPQPSGFLPLSSHTSEPSGYVSPVSQTPAPYSQFHTPPASYGLPVSQTPAPVPNGSYMPPSFHSQQSVSTSTSYGYSSFGVPSSISAPAQQFMTTPSPQSSYPPQNASPQHYSPSHPHEIMHPPTPPQTLPYANGLSSRPLPPQPQVVYTHPVVPHQPVHSHSLPEPSLQSSASFDASQMNGGYSPNPSYSAVPLPTPPQQYAPNDVHLTGSPSQLSIPSPASNLPNGSFNHRNRRTSLPVPPVSYQQPVYQQQPPPPPPPSMEYYQTTNPLPQPPSINGSLATLGSYSKDLPKPPAPVNEHGQWIQPGDAYATQGY